jgi:hypothetical protein
MPEPTLTTARTPRHALPFLFPGQAQKEAFVNEALARIDSLLQPVVLGEQAAPPPASQAGDTYLVAAPASGEWAGRDGMIANWSGTHWLFAPPWEGARVHDAASGALAVFSGAAGWRRAAAPPVPDGGTTQDLEARAAIAAIVARLHSLAIFSA